MKHATLGSHATDEPSLRERIDAMEARLAVERAQLVAHARAYGGTVRRRLASPTSLLFATSIGFIAAEVLSARSAAARAAQRQGKTKPQQRAAAKSVLESLTRPAMALLHLASMGFLVKQNKDVADTVEAGVAPAAPDESRVLH